MAILAIPLLSVGIGFIAGDDICSVEVFMTSSYDIDDYVGCKNENTPQSGVFSFEDNPFGLFHFPCFAAVEQVIHVLYFCCRLNFCNLASYLRLVGRSLYITD